MRGIPQNSSPAPSAYDNERCSQGLRNCSRPSHLWQRFLNPARPEEPPLDDRTCRLRQDPGEYGLFSAYQKLTPGLGGARPSRQQLSAPLMLLPTGRKKERKHLRTAPPGDERRARPCHYHPRPTECTRRSLPLRLVAANTSTSRSPPRRARNGTTRAGRRS